jgi:hypothetical protein
MKKKFLGICLAICLCYSQSFAFFDTIGAVGQAAIGGAILGMSVVSVTCIINSSIVAGIVGCIKRIFSCFFLRRVQLDQPDCPAKFDYRVRTSTFIL